MKRFVCLFVCLGVAALQSSTTVESNPNAPTVAPKSPLMINPHQYEAFVLTSSLQTQVPNLTTGSLATSDGIDMCKNIEVSKDKSEFTCQIDGVYMISTGIQAAILEPNTSGYLDSWFLLNNAPIPQSNSRMYVSDNLANSLMSNTFIIGLKKGDVVSVGFTASGPNIGMLAIQHPQGNIPAITSYGMILLKIN